MYFLSQNASSHEQIEDTAEEIRLTVGVEYCQAKTGSSSRVILNQWGINGYNNDLTC